MDEDTPHESDLLEWLDEPEVSTPSASGRRHLLHGKDLYTPLTTDIMDLLYRVYVREGTWRGVARVMGMRMQPTRGCRELRKIRAGKVKAISMTVLDRMLTHSGFGVTVSDFTWFTPEDLVELGVWEPDRKRARRRAA